MGTGTVLHTFVGDYNQPEELSVFEGDKVREAAWAALLRRCTASQAGSGVCLRGCPQHPPLASAADAAPV